MRGGQAGPADAACARGFQDLAAEAERGLDPLELGRAEVDVEPLAPAPSAATAPLFSSVAIASTPTQRRNPRTASTRRGPQSGPCSSRSVVANAIGSWIVVASITKPPSSSSWWSMQCAVIG